MARFIDRKRGVEGQAPAGLGGAGGGAAGRSVGIGPLPAALHGRSARVLLGDDDLLAVVGGAEVGVCAWTGATTATPRATTANGPRTLIVTRCTFRAYLVAASHKPD